MDEVGQSKTPYSLEQILNLLLAFQVKDLDPCLGFGN
jgi:hypothetical protein